MCYVRGDPPNPPGGRDPSDAYVIFTRVPSTTEPEELSVPEVLRDFGVDFRGWYSDSAEGVLARYEGEPELVEEFAEELESEEDDEA